MPQQSNAAYNGPAARQLRTHLPRHGTIAADCGRWNTIDMGRLLAAPAARDRAASRPLSVLGTAFVAQVAAGRSENGGGSKGWFGLVLEKRRENIRIPTRR
jgi:hypothetical protein